MMRTFSRALVAGAMALPLMVGAPAAALASDGGGDKGHHGFGYDKWGKYWEFYKSLNQGDTEQDQENSTEQSNDNSTVVYQVSIGNKGDTEQSVHNETDQNNDNDTEQTQASFSK